MDLAGVATITRELSLYRYFSVVNAALLLYDYSLTLSDEVNLVWKARFTPLKVLFFLNRIIAITSCFLEIYLLHWDTNSESCKAVVQALGVFDTLVFICGELMLSLRVYALWLHNRAVGVYLIVVLFGGFAGSFYATGRATADAIAVSYPTIFGDGCLVEYISPKFWIAYAILLLQETSMLVLILARAIITTRADFRPNISKGLQIIVKDGVAYFICIFFLLIAGITVALRVPGDLRSVFSITFASLHSILCARLLLRLRYAYSEAAAVTSTLSSFFVAPSSQRRTGNSGDRQRFEVECMPLDDFGSSVAASSKPSYKPPNEWA